MPYLAVSSPVAVEETVIADIAAELARSLGLPPDAVVAQWTTTTGAGTRGVVAEVRGADRGQPVTARALEALARRLARVTGCPPGHVLATWPITTPGRSVAGDGSDLHPDQLTAEGRKDGPMRPPVDMNPVADPRAAAAECERRALEREGIPVVLALVDERPEPVRCTDERAVAEGARFAELFETYRSAISPDADEQDAAAVYSVVALLGQCHVREGSHA
jgi:hypothetical protein